MKRSRAHSLYHGARWGFSCFGHHSASGRMDAARSGRQKKKMQLRRRATKRVAKSAPTTALPRNPSPCRRSYDQRLQHAATTNMDFAGRNPQQAALFHSRCSMPYPGRATRSRGRWARTLHIDIIGAGAYPGVELARNCTHNTIREFMSFGLDAINPERASRSPSSKPHAQVPAGAFRATVVFAAAIGLLKKLNVDVDRRRRYRVSPSGGKNRDRMGDSARNWWYQRRSAAHRRPISSRT